MSINLKLTLALMALLFSLTGKATESTGTATSTTFTSMDYTSSILPNPDRGWADWSGSDFVNAYDAGAVARAYSQGERLLYCTMDLATFRGTTISSTYLTNLQARFNSVRSAGMKCVMLIGYDIYSGTGNDDTAANISTHLSQLGPILKANADVIAYSKAGFIGAYGEWWGSQHNNSCFGSGSSISGCPNATAAANRMTVRDALMAAFHPYTQIEFRYPDDSVMWMPTPLDSTAASNGSMQSRAGFHNDCQLSGSNDTYTWMGWSSGAAASTLQTYMDAATNNASYGGEISSTCATPHRITCAEARADFSRWHQSWIKNSNADGSEWYNSWSAGGCLNEMKNLSGYRLQLYSVSHQSTAHAGESITVRATMRNLGWSRPFSPRRRCG